jgi:hypothetical protein
MNSNNKAHINKKSPILYQNGVIDIFKLMKIYDLDINKVKKKGEVSSELVTYYYNKNKKVLALLF